MGYIFSKGTVYIVKSKRLIGKTGYLVYWGKHPKTKHKYFRGKTKAIKHAKRKSFLEKNLKRRKR